MSIGGKAELAQHRYHVQKYGIDGVQNSNSDIVRNSDYYSSDDEEDNDRNKGDDWDRFMDITNDNINISFSAKSDTTKRGGKVRVGYTTPSPDQSSSDDDSGNNYFFENKAAIQSLATPEKCRYKLEDADQERTTAWGVTYTRGMQNQDVSSESDDSPNRSTNVSSTSTGSVLERMFRTVLRFNDDFDDELSSSEEDEGSDDDRSSVSDRDIVVNDRNSSVSFAADISFGFNEDFDDHFPSFMKEEESSLEADRSSPGRDRSSDKNSSISFAADTSFAASEIKFHPSPPPYSSKRRDRKASTTSSPTSISSQRKGRNSSKERSSPPCIGSRITGLSPIGAFGPERNLKSPTSAPYDRTPVLDELAVLPHPDDEFQSNAYPADECTNRKLFDEYQFKSSSLCIDYNKHTDEMRTKSVDQCCTQTTVASIESYYETEILTSLSEELSPFSYSRTFGSNAAFRINSSATTTDGKSADRYSETLHDAPNEISEFTSNENRRGQNRRGVTLDRSAKLKALGLGYKLSQSNNRAPNDYGDCSF